MATASVETIPTTIPPHVPAELVFDFDVFDDPRLQGDPQGGHMSLHRDAPDIFFTPRNGGHWMATRFADVTHIMTNPKIFSSVDVRFRAVSEVQGRIPLPPQDMDAPDHMRHRVLLLQFFAPKHLVKQEDNVRTFVNDLIDRLQGQNACNFKEELAIPLPVTIFMSMMDWDIARLREFVGWVHDIIGTNDVNMRAVAFRQLSAYLSDEIDKRLANPGDDPISILLRSEIEGKKLTRERVQEMANLLFSAGLDTVTVQLTFTMKFLAENPEYQDRLRANPHEIKGAVEEFLRRFSFVTTQRRVAVDTEINGIAMKAGDTIAASLSAACNDDRSVANPEKVDLDRGKAPHVAFNTGPHNCVGAPLARLEVRVFLEEWLKRMPNVRIAPGFVPVVRAGPVMTIESLDIVW